MTTSLFPRLATLTLALGTLAGVGAAPASAAPYVYWPGVATGVHVAARTSTAFTVGLTAAAHASQYKVSASTVEADIWLTNIDKTSSHRIVATAATPRITVNAKAYTSDTFYYRVATINGPHVRWSSAYHQTHVTPGTPTALRADTGAAGTYLSWTSPPATGYSIEQATDSAFVGGRRVYTTTNDTHRFTPYGLVQGRTYWFRLRAVNCNITSALSTSVSAVPTTSEQSLRVATYNTSSATFDSALPVHAKWAQRGPAVVGLLKQANPDVVTVEEAGPVVAPGVRQVDAIKAGLGSGYATADTNFGPNPGVRQNSPYTGNYVLYKTASVSPVGTGGHWDVGDDRNAAYQLFRANSSGARFLFVGTHLWSTRGASYDVLRNAETARMVSQAKAYAAANGVSSIVYGGDMNSWPDRYLTTDMPGIQMQNSLVSDAFEAAQSHSNAQYSSINSYLPTPTLGGSADRIFVSGGVGVSNWGQLLNVSGGKFVGVIPSDHNPVYSDITLPA